MCVPRVHAHLAKHTSYSFACDATCSQTTSKDRINIGVGILMCELHY